MARQITSISRPAIIEARRPMASPWVGIANTALRELRKYQTDFGMNPSARVRLPISTPRGNDPLAELERRRDEAEANVEEARFEKLRRDREGRVSAGKAEREKTNG